eukprot:Selendium_serpulae@DN9102_c0_g1_i1.p1
MEEDPTDRQNGPPSRVGSGTTQGRSRPAAEGSPNERIPAHQLHAAADSRSHSPRAQRGSSARLPAPVASPRPVTAAHHPLQPGAPHRQYAVPPAPKPPAHHQLSGSSSNTSSSHFAQPSVAPASSSNEGLAERRVQHFRHQQQQPPPHSHRRPQHFDNHFSFARRASLRSICDIYKTCDTGGGWRDSSCGAYSRGEAR